MTRDSQNEERAVRKGPENLRKEERTVREVARESEKEQSDWRIWERGANFAKRTGESQNEDRTARKGLENLRKKAKCSKGTHLRKRSESFVFLFPPTCRLDSSHLSRPHVWQNKPSTHHQCCRFGFALDPDVRLPAGAGRTFALIAVGLCTCPGLWVPAWVPFPPLLDLCRFWLHTSHERHP